MLTALIYIAVIICTGFVVYAGYHLIKSFETLKNN